MIEAGVPGMRSRVAVIRPPLTEPTYIATRSVNADCASMPKVSGSESAINIAPVRPGIAPTRIPRAVPRTMSAGRAGWDRASKIIAQA